MLADIDAGEKYVTRDGQVTGPLNFGGRYFYDRMRAAYDTDGRRIVGGEPEPCGPRDITKLWERPKNR